MDPARLGVEAYANSASAVMDAVQKSLSTGILLLSVGMLGCACLMSDAVERIKVGLLLSGCHTPRVVNEVQTTDDAHELKADTEVKREIPMKESPSSLTTVDG